MYLDIEHTRYFVVGTQLKLNYESIELTAIQEVPVYTSDMKH